MTVFCRAVSLKFMQIYAFVATYYKSPTTKHGNFTPLLPTYRTGPIVRLKCNVGYEPGVCSFCWNLTKIFWVSYFVEFVLGRFSHFNIAIAYSNFKSCGAWTPSFCEFTCNLSKTSTPLSHVSKLLVWGRGYGILLIWIAQWVRLYMYVIHCRNISKSFIFSRWKEHLD